MRLEFPKPIRKRVMRELVAAGRREIGGVLMGEQIAPGNFRLADFSVDRDSGSGTHFVRRPAHHREALEDFFKRTGSDFSRFNYLGEWHSHPSFPALPSIIDINAMHRVVEEPGIGFSVLLVVRTRYRFMLECSARLFQSGGFESEVEIVR